MTVIKPSTIFSSQSTVLSRLLSTRPPRDVAIASRLVSRPSGTQEWLVVIPDRPNVLERRIAVRPKHSPNFVKLHQQGYVSWAGPLFDNHVENGRPRPFKGSAMVVNDQSKEAALETIALDVYVREGVWDLENALILPIRTIMRRDLVSGQITTRRDQ